MILISSVNLVHLSITLEDPYETENPKAVSFSSANQALRFLKQHLMTLNNEKVQMSISLSISW